MTSLAVQEQGSVQLLATLEEVGGVIDRGLHLPPDLPYERYETIGAMLFNLHNMSRWLIGDWLVFGEDHYQDERYVQAATVTGLADQTLHNMMTTARKVAPQNRNLLVDYSHHQEVQSLRPVEQRRILKRAEKERLTKMQVRDLVNEIKGQGNHRQEIVRDVCGECGRPLP